MSSAGGLHSLATIVKRLEAAAARLEDIVEDPSAVRALAQFAQANRDDTAVSAPDKLAPVSFDPPALQKPVQISTPPAVIAFDTQVLDGVVRPFVALTQSFASQSVIEMAGLVEKQITELRAFILLAASCKKPDDKMTMPLLGPLQASIEAVTRAKDANVRDRYWVTHMTVIAEGAPCVGWVVSPTPVSYVSDIKESVDYYANKVLKEFKEKDPKHVEWVRAFQAILDSMRQYAKDHHTTGLVWNAQGVDTDAYAVDVKPSASADGFPPSPSVGSSSSPSTAAGSGTRPGASAVFAELNKGADVTKGLRKVDRSEMTHKNTALRASGVVPATAGAPTVGPGRKPMKPSKPQALAGKKPAKFVLEGNKWMIEHQENESSLVVEETQLNQSVNVYGCKNCTIVIKGKVNAVTITNCIKLSILVSYVVSSISITASPSFTLQITGMAPMVQVDSTDGGQIYLSAGSLGAEITTAKCSAVNVSVPVEGEEEGVFEEKAVPEMLRSVIKDGKLVTTIVEHAG